VKPLLSYETGQQNHNPQEKDKKQQDEQHHNGPLYFLLKLKPKT